MLLCVQLVGYYAAANTVDYRWIGRRRLTVFSFLMVAAIFAAVAGAYDRLIETSMCSSSCIILAASLACLALTPPASFFQLR